MARLRFMHVAEQDIVHDSCQPRFYKTVATVLIQNIIKFIITDILLSFDHTLNVDYTKSLGTGKMYFEFVILDDISVNVGH